MNQSPSSSATFKNEDASSYDAVVAEFDHFTTLLTTPLAARMIALADIRPGHSVLDVGTGTAVVAFQAAKRVGPVGKVVGIDLSDGMLKVAEDQSARAGLNDRIEFRKMDAEALQFGDGSLDRVLSLFALLHFPNPALALGEMLRVLRPGGSLVVAVGSGSPWFSLQGITHRIRRLPELLLGLQGKILIAPAFLNALVERHIPANGEEQTALARAHHNRTGDLPELVRKAGFVNIRTYWEGHQAIVKTPKEFWDLQRTFSSIGRKRLFKATRQEVDTVREAFLTTCRKVQSRGGKLVYPVGAFYVIAERPQRG